MPLAIVRTPEGPVALVPKVMEGLIALGVVWQEVDGNFHAKDRATIDRMVSEGGLGVCDFCTVPKPAAVFETPNFDMAPGVPNTRSTGGWAACDICAALVRRGDRRQLLERAVAGSSSPHSQVVRAAISDLHDRFWKAWGTTDKGRVATAAGTLSAMREYLDQGPSGHARENRIQLLARRLKVGVKWIEEIAAMTTEQLADRVLAMTKRKDELTDAIDRMEAEIAELQGEADMARRHHHLVKGLAADQARPWMEAIEMQYAALADLDYYVGTGKRAGPVDPEIVESWTLDRYALRRAECYTWGAEALAACRSAARTIPHDTVLRRDLLPSQAISGWWYFPGPIPVKTTSWDDAIVALLWGWVIERPTRSQQPRLFFSTYVIGRQMTDEHHLHYVPFPTQRWLWAEGETFHQMIARCAVEYDEGAERRASARMAVDPFPKDAMLKAVADLALFFLAGCAWMQQRILTCDSGHVERHRRKQLHRERQLDALPNDVKIVQLRRLEPQHEVRTGEGGTVTWSCRWTVDGHFRNQPWGKAHGDRKLIWIMPFVKGPADRPLKIPAHKVYVVNR